MMNKIQIRRMRRVAAVALLMLAASAAWALQAVVWSSVDGGAGVSSGVQSGGTTLALAGTAGQADAGTLSGGAYVLNGGFVQPDSAFTPTSAARGEWQLY